MTINDLRKGRYSCVGQDYFVTFNTHCRRPYMENYRIANIVSSAIYNQHQISVMAWVVMPDHVHILFTLEKSDLDKVIRKLKSGISRKIQSEGYDFQWAVGYYDHAIRQEESRIHIARYIVANPLRARLVKQIGLYPWWDCIYL